MADAQSLRTRFLQSSAQTMFLSSPSTSRQLSFESAELGHSQSSRLWHGSLGACTACGNLLLPGWTASTDIVSSKVKTRRERPPKREEIRKKILSWRCLFCHRITKETVAIDSSSRKRDVPLFVTQERQEEGPGSVLAPEKPTKSSSKKRAKVRKDREGLQALLDKRTQNKLAPSLNLMDLMKP